mmetsp:Transcript_10636/g.14721  ORF Transcript_10636/g.14721 Transcript_10636/m.14721 type:complete len:244 (+) Transcript_10636:114-845(+)
MFSQLTEASASEIEALESSLPNKIMEIDQKLASLGSSSLGDIEKKFSTEIKNGPEVKNGVVANLLNSARQEAATAILNMSKFERFIILNIPAAEDGNNFGVSVQLEARKMVTERRAKVKELFDKCADYHKERATLLKEIVMKKSIETSENKTQQTDNEQKESEITNSTKTSTKSSTETKTSAPSPLPDALAAVVALDVHWYFHLYFTLEFVRDSYILCGDGIIKNKSRIAKPKGDGSSHMSMF